MANIMQQFRVKNKVTRDSYDLSKKLAFTAQPGELLPVYARYLMPGDVFNIECKWKTRTAPVNTAAFTRFREYYDWFFVPMNLLWDKYNTWITNMTDNNQVATSIKGGTRFTDKHPYFTSDLVQNYVYRMKTAAEQTSSGGALADKNAFNLFGFERWKLSAKLLHYLGYGDFFEPNGANNSIYNLELSPWRLLAYQKIYQDWFRNTQWETSSPQTFNINYMSGAEDDLAIPIDEIQPTDNSMFDLRYANWNKDLFMGVLPNSQYGDAASVDLSSLLEFNDTSKFGYFGLLSENSSGSASFSDNYSVPGFSSQLLNSNSSSLSGSFGFASGGVNIIAKSMGLTPERLSSTFTILALRQAEALQKYKEIQQSNSQDIPSQIDAHFGVRPNEAYSQRCRRIGGYDGTIEISDVDNTNITENEDGSFNGADIAGKGLSFGSGNMSKFSTDVPGILMCIYHCVPLLDYSLGGVAMDNMKTLYTDYPIPEFDKTGMMQVPLAALTNRPADIDPFFQLTVLGSDGLLGYAPNYIDSKTDIDEVKGAFYNGNLDAWVAPIGGSYLSQWWIQNADSYLWKGLDWKFFKINPSVLNPIFATDATADVSTDKIWVNCYFDIKAVRPLDAQGLPY